MHDVIVAIPAGRRKYLELLIPQLLREEGFDELQLWLNAENREDGSDAGLGDT